MHSLRPRMRRSCTPRKDLQWQRARHLETAVMLPRPVFFWGVMFAATSPRRAEASPRALSNNGFLLPPLSRAWKHFQQEHPAAPTVPLMPEVVLAEFPPRNGLRSKSVTCTPLESVCAAEKEGIWEGGKKKGGGDITDKGSQKQNVHAWYRSQD